METERPKTSSKRSAVEKLSSQWRDEEDINKSEGIINKLTAGITEPQISQERSLSQSSVKNALVRVGSALQTTIPAKTRLARPPSASAYLQKGSTANACFNVASTMAINSTNTELSPTFNIHSGDSRTRQVQDRKHYKDSLELEICELLNEIKVIANDIEAKKRQWTVVDHDVEAKLASELAKINEQLADHINLNRSKREIKKKMKELNMINDFKTTEIKEIIVIREVMERKLHEGEGKPESEDKNDERIVELMDPNTQTEYIELIEKRKELRYEIKREQQEIDFILAEKVKLEKQIKLLYPQIVETEEKKKFEKQDNKINSENEQKSLIDQRKQDYLKIVSAERKMEGNDKKSKIQNELNQMEIESEEIQFEQMIKYDALKKEIHERIAVFENKLDEMIKSHDDLEKFIKENRERIDLKPLKDKAMKSIKQYNTHFQVRMKSIR